MKNYLSFGFQHIHLVIIFAISGFAITFLTLNANYKEYQELPNKVSICTSIKQLTYCDTFTVKKQFQIPPKTNQAAPNQINEKGYILFHYNPAFLIWTMLILLLITLCAGSFPVFCNTIFEIRKNYDLSTANLIYTLCFGLLIVSVMVLIPKELRGYYNPYEIAKDLGILFKNPYVIQGIIIATSILVLPTILSMFLVATAGNTLVKKFSQEDNIKSAAEQFSRLHGYLLAALQVLAIVVVLTGFCSSGLRQSIKSLFVLNDFDIFPKEMSYAYGLFYAMFLALFYFPVYYSLKRNAQQIKNNLFANSENLSKDALKRRHQAVQRLETKTTAIESLKLALTILSPLLTSFIPEYLHLFK